MASISLNKIRNKKPGDIAFDVAIILISIIMFFVVAYPIYFIVIASISDPTFVSKIRKYKNLGRFWLYHSLYDCGIFIV